jgi:hypothetical protein
VLVAAYLLLIKVLRWLCVQDLEEEMNILVLFLTLLLRVDASATGRFIGGENAAKTACVDPSFSR